MRRLIIGGPTTGKSTIVRDQPARYVDFEHQPGYARTHLVDENSAPQVRASRLELMLRLLQEPQIVLASWWCSDLLPYMGAAVLRAPEPAALLERQRAAIERRRPAFDLAKLYSWRLDSQADYLSRHGVPVYWLPSIECNFTILEPQLLRDCARK